MSTSFHVGVEVIRNFAPSIRALAQHELLPERLSIAKKG